MKEQRNQDFKGWYKIERMHIFNHVVQEEDQMQKKKGTLKNMEVR
tara:strand:+ start:146 stop:280 length:135 start_codon:yes stop_codon:yes gene_type:complete